MVDDPEESARERDARGGGMLALLGATFLAFINYASMLPVAPMWAARGGADGLAVGAVTGGMMAATVVAQLAMPVVLRGARLRTLILVGLVLLGVPTPMYLLSADFLPIMAITVVRGIGFALVVIAAAALVAMVAGKGRLASAVSWFGIAAALPNLGALAGGVWVADVLGFEVVFWTAGLACGAAALAALRLPGHRFAVRLRGLDLSSRVTVPLVMFFLVAGAFGAVTTFLPLAAPSAGAAALALLVASVTLVAARLFAGYIGDRHGSGRLLVVAVGVAAAGLGLIALSLQAHPAWLSLGAGLLGAGFGASQNDSYVTTLERLGRDNTGVASTIWNVSYDGGTGAGAVVLGGVVGLLGHAAGFAILAAVMLAAALGVGVVGVAAGARRAPDGA